jgi:hypothetical protein
MLKWLLWCLTCSGGEDDQFYASGYLIAFMAEHTLNDAILRGSNLLLHLHGFENHQRITSFDLITRSHQHPDDLAGGGSMQVASGRRSLVPTLGGIKEAVFPTLVLQDNLAHVFAKGGTLKDIGRQLKNLLPYGNAVAVITVLDWHDIDLNRGLVCGAASIGKSHARPPRRQPS